MRGPTMFRVVEMFCLSTWTILPCPNMSLAWKSLAGRQLWVRLIVTSMWHWGNSTEFWGYHISGLEQKEESIKVQMDTWRRNQRCCGDARGEGSVKEKTGWGQVGWRHCTWKPSATTAKVDPYCYQL